MAWRTTPVSVVRAGDFKLMEFFEDGRLELYNLREDVGEKNNLAARMPEKAKELHGRLVVWRQQVGARMPAANDQQSKAAATGDGPAKDAPRRGGRKKAQ